MTDRVIITHMRPIITEEPIPRVKIPIERRAHERTIKGGSPYMKTEFEQRFR